MKKKKKKKQKRVEKFGTKPHTNHVVFTFYFVPRDCQLSISKLCSNLSASSRIEKCRALVRLFVFEEDVKRLSKI